MRGFGNLLDPGHLLMSGDVNGDHRSDALFYDRSDGNWWLGASDGNALGWHLVGSTPDLGDLTR